MEKRFATIKGMEIYIEYAFLENFVFDGTLLCLALYAAKIKIKWWKVCISSALGGLFALLFPLLHLSDFLKSTLKIAVGGLLCLLTTEGLKTKKERGRCLFTCIFFYIFSFGFGGTLLAVYGGEVRVESWLVFLGFTILTFLSVYLVRKLYARRAVSKRVFPCRLFHGEKEVKTQAFLDSGNLAQKDGLPVCFLSPDLFYELYGEEILEDRGQVCDEIVITTFAGEKTVRLYRGEIEIEKKRIGVYFSSSKNMIGREYKASLNFGEDYEID